MTRVALNGIRTRRLRTALTALAIVLGVAMVSAAFTFTDTLGGGADALSKASYDRTDAVVSARTVVEPTGDDGLGARPTVSESSLREVRAVPGVERAVGTLVDDARLVDQDGKVLGGFPFFGVGRDPAAGDLEPFTLTEGRFARGVGEVAIDAKTAASGGYAVGDRIGVQARGPARTLTISGIVTFGDVDSIGSSSIAVFDLGAAQELFGRPGAYSQILVAGDAGVRKRLADALPARLRVQTAAADDRFILDQLDSFVSILRAILLAFGGIAIFVGAFTIYNTLSITVAQRSRELALLRALGATRRQVRRTVLVEALALGAVASAIGIGLGLLLARGLSSLFKSLNVDLPQTTMSLSGRTVIVSLLVGVLVTLAAAIAPALRSTRVEPVEAMRDGVPATTPRGRRRTTVAAAIVGALALVVLGFSVFGGGIEATDRLALLAPGALLTLIAVALIASRLVPALASVLGRPGARIAGPAGDLARRNAMRNSGRTAVAAAALMIGIALVAFSAVLASGLRSATTGALDEQVRGDFVLVNQDDWSPIDPGAVAAVREVAGVRTAEGLVQGRGRAFGEPAKVDGVDPERIAGVFGWEWQQGSDADLAKLAGGGAVVTDLFAEKHGLAVGKRFSLATPEGGTMPLTVAGISKPDRFDPLLLGDVTIARDAFAGAFATERERFGFVDADASARPAIERALAPFADAALQTKEEFKTAQAAWVDQILAIFYLLLGLAVIVSLFGIVNTMALSVVERTRELGMLRAIGMTRRQVRRMVRHESVVTALIGAVLGIGVGLALGALAAAALSGEGLRFSVPVGSLVAFTVVAALAGVLAAMGPARRASRLDVIRALEYE